MDGEVTKLVGRMAAQRIREMARDHGFSTRRGVQYCTKGDFFLYVFVEYLESYSDNRGNEGGLSVLLNIKPLEIDPLYWRICRLEQDPDPIATDPIYGVNTVPGLCFDARVFPLSRPEDVDRVCQTVLATVDAQYARFFTMIASSVEWFYRYVLTVDYMVTWGSELLFPIAYLQLGRIAELLKFMDDKEVHNRMLSHYYNGQYALGQFRSYCRFLQAERR